MNWQLIAQCYENGEASIATICTTFGISQSTFYRHRKQEGWRRGGALAARPKADLQTRTKKAVSEQASKHGDAGPDRAERRGLVRRLFAAWEQRLGMIEEQIVSDDAAIEAVGVEKQTRALSLLVRDFEKLSGIYEQLSGDAADPAGQASTEQPSAADAEGWRQTLARRLERLCEARAT